MVEKIGIRLIVAGVVWNMIRRRCLIETPEQDDPNDNPGRRPWH